MPSLKKALSSSLGRKYLMAVSGLALVGFLITHLAGNLTLLDPSGVAFNTYSKKLEDLGILLEVAEVGLFGAFVVHLVMAVVVTLQNRKARSVGYRMQISKGGASKNSLTSRNMIVTGLVILLFLIVHMGQFKWGPGMAEGYVAQLKGESVRDLHRLVVEIFKQPLFLVFYVGSMCFVGFHFRHGFWSAFQSLGATTRKTSDGLYCLAWLLGLVMLLGFALLPVFVFFFVPAVGGAS